MVSWNDVQEFLARLNHLTGKNYRLPTEIEWEFAACGSTASSGCTYSGSSDVNDVAWYKKNSRRRSQLVGTKLPNDFGIHDMSGNVGELCEDRFRNNRVVRGGNFLKAARRSKVTSRMIIRSFSRLDHVGFRVLLPVTSLSTETYTQPSQTVWD